MKIRLKPENRALFDAGREGLAPTDDDRARVAKALGLNLGVGAGIASATAKAVAGSAAASPVVAGVSSGIVAAKWVAVVALVASLGAGVALYRAEPAHVHSPPPATVGAGAVPAREPSASRGPGAVRPQLAGEEQPRAAAPRGLPSPGSLAPATESPKPADVAPARPAVSGASSAATRAVAVPPEPSEASSTPGLATTAASSPKPDPSAGAAAGVSGVRVAEEAHLLREADAALRAGDTAGATRFLDDHARLFPRGVLAEEREVQRVLVLCSAGQADAARVAASRFLRAYPQSLLAGRVRASCGAP